MSNYSFKVQTDGLINGSCRLFRAGIPDFQSKCVPVFLLRETWTPAANWCLFDEFLNVTGGSSRSFNWSAHEKERAEDQAHVRKDFPLIGWMEMKMATVTFQHVFTTQTNASSRVFELGNPTWMIFPTTNSKNTLQQIMTNILVFLYLQLYSCL